MWYNPRDPNRYKWGFDIQANEPNKLAWFKLLLNEQPDGATLLGLNNQLQIRQRGRTTDAKQAGLEEIKATASGMPADKSTKDVVADYLNAIHTHALGIIRDSYPPSVSEQFGKAIPIKYHLTVPAIWSDRAKELTIQAAKAAGMTGPNSEISLITEPEAAALHCLHDFQGTEQCLKEPEPLRTGRFCLQLPDLIRR
ncbi:hypothetical protein BDZ91DRAFT_786644 [Kalaharituber pfeilii]|nr:hypothetical protein BDZ91DRAFT_786644 [Kalaharituber pfeilii]